MSHLSKEHTDSSSYLHHDSDSFNMSLEVKVEELVLEPLGKAGGHLSFQLLHIFVSWGGEVPLQDLRKRGKERGQSNSSLFQAAFLLSLVSNSFSKKAVHS